MNLIKAEYKKTLTEAVSYYPDYIVGLLTDLLLLFTQTSHLNKCLCTLKIQ